jgi:hypothetical protein
MISGMAESEGLKKLRLLAARRVELSTEIDDATEALLREGEFVADVADALGVSRETIRRFRDEHHIPDAREIRKEKGTAFRRDS